jgi:hypothetical protein
MGELEFMKNPPWLQLSLKLVTVYYKTPEKSRDNCNERPQGSPKNAGNLRAAGGSPERTGANAYSSKNFL